MRGVFPRRGQPADRVWVENPPANVMTFRRPKPRSEWRKQEKAEKAESVTAFSGGRVQRD